MLPTLRLNGIHSKFGTRKVPEEWGVGAQWVGNRKFGLKEDPHMPREALLELSIQIEQKTQLFLEQMTEKDLITFVTAPWGEEMTFKELIYHCFEHDFNHQGQIQLLITYFYQQ
jgi:hypothetical protein